MTAPVEDIAFDTNFEAYITERGDLAGWSGKDRFEGHVVLRISTRYREIIGDYEPSTIRTKLRQEAARVARRMNQIEDIAALTIEFVEDQPNTVRVTIIYDTTDEFSETIKA